MSNKTNVDTLDFVDVAGQALHEAQVLATKVAEAEQKVAEIAPQRADALHEAGLIEAGEKQAAVDQLSTHEGALAVCGNLIKILGETKLAYERKLAAVGQGVAEPGGNGQANGQSKQAAAGDAYDDGGFVGGRAGLGEKRASDDALIQGLGLGGRLGS